MSKYRYLTTMIALIGYPAFAQAQALSTTKSFYDQYQLEIVLSIAALVCVLALLALFTALFALKAILFDRKSEEEKVAIVEGPSFWATLWVKMNNRVPIEEEGKVMTSHSYDGIQELDNSLPPWWLYGFFLTIAFGIIYLLNFHVFKSGDLQTAEYVKEMAVAKAEVATYLASMDNLIDETSVTLLDEEADLAVGKELFIGKCAACHGQKGEGGVGPNFADKYWIHGGDIASIFKTVKYGVPSKGMIAWQAQLTPKEMQQVSSYIYFLEGTNPDNQKAPQGELFERGESKEESDSTHVEEESDMMEASM
ncbi:MAG: cytochrome c oxidase cbb3-type subunit 3 [Marinoscillum sp.]|jgi:cytochrome c oxidase cbb3-type subunit 3